MNDGEDAADITQVEVEKAIKKNQKVAVLDEIYNELLKYEGDTFITHCSTKMWKKKRYYVSGTTIPAPFARKAAETHETTEELNKFLYRKNLAWSPHYLARRNFNKMP